MPALNRAHTNPYNRAHRTRRATLIRQAIGTPCPSRTSPHCTGLMTDPQRMHLDHTTPLALGGDTGDRIICAHCNTSTGATLGNQLRNRPTRRATREW